MADKKDMEEVHVEEEGRRRYTERRKWGSMGQFFVVFKAIYKKVNKN